MPNGAKTDKNARTHAEIRQERLAVELRANLLKRKQQARTWEHPRVRIPVCMAGCEIRPRKQNKRRPNDRKRTI